jgi:hypothetical protein
VTETEIITHRIMDAWQHKNIRLVEPAAQLCSVCADPVEFPSWELCLCCQSQLHPCAIPGCTNLTSGHDCCARCDEEREGTPYTFADILYESPAWARRLFWTSVFIGGTALGLLVVLV